MVTKCEVYNEVGKSEETITLEVTCKYFVAPYVSYGKSNSPPFMPSKGEIR